MRKTHIIRSICLLLCLAMSLSFSSVHAVAFGTTPLIDSGFSNRSEDAIEDTIIIDPIHEQDPIESVSLDQLKGTKPGDKSIDELQKMEVDVKALPEFINVDTAIEKEHVNRLYQQESSLSTVVFQNRDGSKSMYFFNRPVKYFDSNGSVRDKSTKITLLNKSDYAYGMIDNSIQVLFPNSTGYGTLIRYNDYSISMIPVATTSDQIEYNEDDNTIIYSSAFGKNTSVRYQTKMNGLKEDIILYELPESNVFRFKLLLNGLTPKQIDNQWCLIDEKENVIACFGNIDISDASGKSTIGNMDVYQKGQNSEYEICITVPADFLISDSTVYPVCVDPTTYIWEDGYIYNEYGGYDSYNAITDTGLYTTTSAVTNAQTNTDYHKLGYNSSANGKIIYKLYDFFGEYGQYKDLKDSQIGLAHLYINVGTGSGTTVTVNPMTNTWNVSTYGENPIALCNSSLWSAYSSNYSSSLPLDSTSGERGIDITNILRGWARYNSGTSTAAYDNPANGFVLSSSSTTTYRNITAAEEFYANSVYVVMDTNFIGGSYYVNNVVSGQFLKRASNSSVSTSKYSNTDNIRWQFEYLGNNKFYIKSRYNTNYALHGSGSSVSLAYIPSNPSDNFIWDVSTAAHGGMIIKNKYNNRVLRYDGSSLSLVPAMSSTDSNYDQTVWGIAEQSYYVNLTSFSVTSPEWLAVGSSQYAHISATPSNATWKSASNFTWSSSNNSVAAVSTDGRITGNSTGYALITANHKMTNCTYSFYVTIGQTIPLGTYYIMNKETGRFLDVEGPSTAEGAYIQQWDLHNGNQAKWLLSYHGDGYYYIKSVYSNKYVSVYGSSTAAGAVIHQVSAQSDANRWRILRTSSGAYKLISKCGESNSRCLGLPSTGNYNGLDCKQITYAKDNTYRDEWYISSTEKRIRINIQMDNGYISRYTNLSTATSRIEDNLFKVREKYAEYFGICVDYSAVTTITSHADTCTGCTYSTACTHCSNTDCKSSTVNDITKLYNLHHKNIYNVMARFEMPDLDTETLLVFIGHKTCATDGSGHRGGYLGLTYPGYGIISLTNFESVTSESKTTMHEIGHLYYAKDHYNIGSVPSTAEIIISEGDTRYNSDCIYGENKEDPDIAGNHVICGGCRARIESYSNRFNH